MAVWLHANAIIMEWHMSLLTHPHKQTQNAHKQRPLTLLSKKKMQKRRKRCIHRGALILETLNIWFI